MRFFAVANFGLKIANLSVNIEPKAGTAAELQDLSPWAPVVAGTISYTNGVGVSIEFAVVNALHAVYRACKEMKGYILDIKKV